MELRYRSFIYYKAIVFDDLAFNIYKEDRRSFQVFRLYIYIRIKFENLIFLF